MNKSVWDDSAISIYAGESAINDSAICGIVGVSPHATTLWEPILVVGFVKKNSDTFKSYLC